MALGFPRLRPGVVGDGGLVREGGNQGGKATREGVHGVSPIGGVVLSGVIVLCFLVLRLRVWMYFVAVCACEKRRTDKRLPVRGFLRVCCVALRAAMARR